MGRKRLSKEYMELLMRNQNSVIINNKSDSDSDIYEEKPQYAGNQENINDDVVTDTQGGVDFTGEQFLENILKENALEEDITNDNQEIHSLVLTDNIAKNKQFSDEFRIECDDTPVITPVFKPRRKSYRKSLDNFEPRRLLVTQRPTFSHFDRLMEVASDERRKHREMINSVTNTTFALSRRPLTYYKNFNVKSKRKCLKSPPISVRTKRPIKRVRFGTQVTFEDGSSPLPVRPPRHKSLRSARSRSTPSTPRSLAPQLNRKNYVMVDSQPEKPRRVYKGRERTPLNQALQPLEDQQYDSALDRIKALRKAVQGDSKEQNKKRSVLSSLNLFLALVYERMRSPTVPAESLLMIVQDTAGDCSGRGNIDPHCSTRIPSAVEQLTRGEGGRVHLRNIPTLLLFNLIYGRPL